MIITVQKIKLKTVVGYDAEITGINPASSDCLVGSINGQSVSWNFRGICRDNESGGNLSTQTDEFKEIQETLGAVVPEKNLN